ncbi:MAG: ABC transporter ATP-binding protein [Cyclobacteriaceae bacterium]
MIHVQNITKTYQGATVLHIDNLLISKGESVGLIGNNGAGKTTLFRTILDLIKPDSGFVALNGIPVTKSEEWKRILGAYLDENFLISYLTPEEYFDFAGKLHGLSHDDVSAHLSKFEALFNNEVIGQQKYIRDLSKGNLKKVGIAAAFLGNPEIVLLDEPFENLDPSSQIKLSNLLIQERNMREVTYFISSHDLSHASKICQRIIIMEKGTIKHDLVGEECILNNLQEYFTA